MAAPRIAPRPLINQDGEPFDTAEQAWFWFCLCQIGRNEGARFAAGLAAVPRACDPDDIYRAVLAQVRAGRLGPGHLRVLEVHGLRQCPPGRADPPFEQTLWLDALDALAAVLRRKGLLRTEETP